MSRKLRYVLFVLLLVVPLVLAACGGDDDKQDDNASSGAALTETFESPQGIKLMYPKGWVATEQASGIIVANSQATLDKAIAGGSENNPTKDEGALVVTSVPAAALGEGLDLKGAFDMMMQGMAGEGMATDGDAVDFKVGGNDARRQNVKSAAEQGEGFIAVMQSGDTLIIGILATGTGGRATFEADALKIFESITYTAPAS